ncbi:MAG: glycosyltransferase family 39 protein [Acidimicrobiales bacterium]
MYLLAGLLRLAEVVWPGALTSAGGPYLFARIAFVALAVLSVAAAIAVGHRLADPGRERLTGLATGTLLAVSYLSVRLSRQVHPEHLQVLAVLIGFLLLLRFDSTRRIRWLVAAGALAGLAAATKYAGGALALPAVAAVVFFGGSPWGTKARQLAALGVGVVGGIIAGAPLILSQAGDVWAGVRFQFGHQAGGHLGYDQPAPSYGFHLLHSLPGNWGWPVTVLAVVGMALVVARGTRAQRLGALLGGSFFVVLGASGVRFPHYMVPALPFLGALAVVAAGRALARLDDRVAMAGALALAVSVAPAALNDLRLIRTAGAQDTRLVAAAIVSRLPEPVLAERYATPEAGGSLGDQPDAPACDCFVAISSYMEQRYRREPDRYAAAVAVYNRLRAQGRVVAEIAPSRPLRYDWDVLPEWGLGRTPLLGEVGRTGPTVTILDLRTAPGGGAEQAPPPQSGGGSGI